MINNFSSNISKRSNNKSFGIVFFVFFLILSLYFYFTESNINLYVLPIEYNRRGLHTKEKCVQLKKKGDPRFGEDHLKTRVFHYHGLNKLNPKGKIIILSLDTKINEMPTFTLMNKKLKRSLNRDKKIIDLIIKIYPKIIIKKFIFNVKILKSEYLEMIEKRYISTLLNLSDKQIKDGLVEIDLKYKKDLKFRDRLICLILKK